MVPWESRVRKRKHLGDPCNADAGYQDVLGGTHSVDGDVRDLQCMPRTGHENMPYACLSHCLGMTQVENVQGNSPLPRHYIKI